MQNKMSKLQDRVLVVGGGLGGIRAALDLAEAGRNVVVIEEGTSFGGLMKQLDRTFPTNNCDLGSIFPRLSTNGTRKRIELRAMTRATAVKGEAGNAPPCQLYEDRLNGPISGIVSPVALRI